MGDIPFFKIKKFRKDRNGREGTHPFHGCMGSISHWKRDGGRWLFRHISLSCFLRQENLKSMRMQQYQVEKKKPLRPSLSRLQSSVLPPGHATASLGILGKSALPETTFINFFQKGFHNTGKFAYISLAKCESPKSFLQLSRLLAYSVLSRTLQVPGTYTMKIHCSPLSSLNAI